MIKPQTTFHSRTNPQRGNFHWFHFAGKSCAPAIIAVFLVINLFCPLDLFGQLVKTQIRSFGSPSELGLEPYARLRQTKDGVIYGTTYFGGGATDGAVFKIQSDGSGYTVVHPFTGLYGDGGMPSAGLIQASDNALYGVTTVGGNSGLGALYRLESDGSGFRILRSFIGAPTDGNAPYADLTEGKDGMLYGTTQTGGSTNQGTIFKVGKDGNGFALLRSFGVTTNDGYFPYGGVIEGTDGILYGASFGGGDHLKGNIYKLNKDGSGYAVLHTFSASGAEGAGVFSRLIEGNDGLLYGATSLGGTISINGATNLGTIFRMNKDGSAYQVLHEFGSVAGDGTQPIGGLMEASDGALYGATSTGGGTNLGAIYKLNKDGSGYAVLHSFDGPPGDGSTSYSGLMEAADGTMWGVTAYGGTYDRGTIYKFNKDGSGYATLHNFVGTLNEVSSPQGKLLEGSDKVLYGTSSLGGTTNQGGIFKMNRDGSGYQLLHSFSGTDGDGGTPSSELIEAGDGFLYGTTPYGGTTNVGTIFKLNKDGGGYVVLHDFNGVALGRNPFGRMLQGSDGVLYGVTLGGGSSDRGAVFKLNKDGSGYSVLHSFAGGGNGAAFPYGGLTEASDGILYGTTFKGGTSDNGTVFKMNKNGSGYSVIRRFTGQGGDGSQAYTAVMEASDKFLYGATYGGGTSDFGTVYKMAKDGNNYSVIYRFTGVGGDGAHPATNAELVEGIDGALYGTTAKGGNYDQGTVYKVNKDGSNYSIVCHFSGSNGDGSVPYSGLILASDAALYGTTGGGGLGCGTVFRLAPTVSLEISQRGEMSLKGSAGFRFTLQRSDDIASANAWVNVTNVVLLADPTPVVDPAFGRSQRSFYRALLTR